MVVVHCLHQSSKRQRTSCKNLMSIEDGTAFRRNTAQQSVWTKVAQGTALGGDSDACVEPCNEPTPYKSVDYRAFRL